MSATTAVQVMTEKAASKRAARRMRILLALCALTPAVIIAQRSIPAGEHLSRQAVTVKAQTAKLTLAAQAAERAAAENATAAQLAALSAALPDQPGVRAALGQVTALAEQSGVQVESGSTRAQPDVRGDGLYSWTMTLVVTVPHQSTAAAGAGRVQRFVNALGQAPRLYTVDSVSLSQPSAASDLTGTIVVRFYSHTNADTATAPAPAAAPAPSQTPSPTTSSTGGE